MQYSTTLQDLVSLTATRLSLVDQITGLSDQNTVFCIFDLSGGWVWALDSLITLHSVSLNQTSLLIISKKLRFGLI